MLVIYWFEVLLGFFKGVLMSFGLGLAVYGGCRFCHSDTGSGINWTIKTISSGMFCHSGDNVLCFRTISHRPWMCSLG